MGDVLHADCPSCGCPDQHVGLRCGFCNTVIPTPRGAVAPDGTVTVAEVFGYKGFIPEYRTGRDVRLLSPLFSTVWEPGQWMIAECNQRGEGYVDLAVEPDNYHGSAHPDPAHWSPVKGCGGSGHGCGFYAGRTHAHLIELGYANNGVIAKVQMQGKIIPATNGFRAQQMRPVTIFVSYEQWELGRDLKAVYGPHGVNVEMGTTAILPATGESAIEWCHKCKAKMNRTPTCPCCGHNHR